MFTQIYSFLQFLAPKHIHRVYWLFALRYCFIITGLEGLVFEQTGFDKDGKAFEQNPSSGKVLVMLSFATSINSCAIVSRHHQEEIGFRG